MIAKNVALTSSQKAILEKQAKKLVEVVKCKANLKIKTKTLLELVENNTSRRFKSLTSPL